MIWDIWVWQKNKMEEICDGPNTFQRTAIPGWSLKIRWQWQEDVWGTKKDPNLPLEGKNYIL